MFYDPQVKSHGTSTRGKPLTLVIENAITSNQTQQPQQQQPSESQATTTTTTAPEVVPLGSTGLLKLDVHSNETITNLKVKIKELINFTGLPRDLVLTTKKEQIREENKTLNDLQV